MSSSTSPPPTGRNVRAQGIDFTRRRGAAAQGPPPQRPRRHAGRRHELRRPCPSTAGRKLAVLGTGDELVAPGSTPGPGEIVYSNGFALVALAGSAGAEVIDLGIARDRLGRHRRRRAQGARMAAPTSWSPPVAPPSASTIWCSARCAAEGLELSFWRVALRPGRPMLHGRLGAMHVLGRARQSGLVLCLRVPLPAAADRRLAGRNDVDAGARAGPPRRATCRPMTNAQDYLRARLEPGPDGPVATPLPQPGQFPDGAARPRPTAC